MVESLTLALADAQASMTSPLRRLKAGVAPDPAARAAAAAAAAFRAQVAAVVAQVHSTGGPPGSIGAALRACVDPATGTRLSRAQLTGEVATFIMGGFETTAHSLAFTLLRLAGCAGALAAVEAGLEAAGLLVRRTPGDRASPLVPGRPLTHADLRALPGAMAAVREGMRLHPTVPGMPRLTDRDVVLGGRLIPAGTMVYCLLRAAHRDVGVWGPDAARFRPGRWLGEEGEGEGVGGAKGADATHSPASPRPASPRVKAFTPAAARGGRVGGVDGGGHAEEEGLAAPHRPTGRRQLPGRARGPGPAGEGLAGATPPPSTPATPSMPPPSSAPPKAYFPFSDGPRDCMGQTLAMAILQTAVVGLVTRFRLALPPPGGAGDADVCPASRRAPGGVTGELLEVKECLMLTAHAAGGAVLRLEERV